MEKVVKGMVQVAGITYRIVGRARGHFNVVQVLDDAAVGEFTSPPRFDLCGARIEPAPLRELAPVAVQSAKTGWGIPAFLE